VAFVRTNPLSNNLVGKKLLRKFYTNNDLNTLFKSPCNLHSVPRIGSGMVFHFSFSIQELFSLMLSHNIFVCKYFNNSLLLKGVIDQMPNLFDIWQDSKTKSTMFCKDLDHQGVVNYHLLDCTNGIWTTLRTPRPHLTWLYK
jgi:hypothetical protein